MAARFAGLPEGVARPARLRAHAGRARKRMGARPRIQARQAAAARREHAGPAGPIQAESSAHRSACVAVARPRIAAAGVRSVAAEHVESRYVGELAAVFGPDWAVRLAGVALDQAAWPRCAGP